MPDRINLPACLSPQSRTMRTSLHRSLVLAMCSLVMLSACGRGRSAEVPAPPPEPVAREPLYRTGEEVLGAMRERYAGKWFNTMTFTQKTSRLLPNGTWNVQTWYEAIRVPGKLRIDFDPISAGNGVLYVRDSQFVVQNGRPLRGDPGVNELMLLGFDVYASASAAHGVAAAQGRIRPDARARDHLPGQADDRRRRTER